MGNRSPVRETGGEWGLKGTFSQVRRKQKVLDLWKIWYVQKAIGVFPLSRLV